MFNKSQHLIKKNLLLIGLLFFVSCKKNTPLIYSEEVIIPKTQATIELVYPKFEGNSNLATRLNKTIKQTIAKGLIDTLETTISLDDAINKFDTDYKSFKLKYQESQLEWEALVDSEITYQSNDIICIAVNTYINTGGAHGNAFIEFLNVNAKTGALLTHDEFIKNRPEFIQLAKTHFIKMLNDSDEGLSLENCFLDGIFKLPEQIGFSDEGIILLYNTYEILPNTQGITELTIPFNETDVFLQRH